MLHFRKEDTRTRTSNRDGIPAGKMLKTRKPSFDGTKKMEKLTGIQVLCLERNRKVGCSGNSRPRSLFWRELGLRTAETAK